MSDTRTDLLLKRAAEDVEAVRRIDAALAENTRRRASAAAEGQTDLTRFVEADRDLREHREECRKGAVAFRREARGEPCPVTRNFVFSVGPKPHTSRSPLAGYCSFNSLTAGNVALSAEGAKGLPRGPSLRPGESRPSPLDGCGRATKSDAN